MSIERYLRLIAGFLRDAERRAGLLGQSRLVSVHGFVGLNLFQSAFTNWCPMMTFLRKLGVNRRRASTRFRQYVTLRPGATTSANWARSARWPLRDLIKR